jgi:hypothetical protein
MTAECRPPQPRTPLDFKLIQERVDKVYMRDREEVDALLGPPSPQQSWEPEFAPTEEMVRYHPDRYPSGPFWWTKWTDPQDENKWVAILFAGGKGCHVVKKGF